MIHVISHSQDFLSHRFTIFQYDILPSYNFESNSVKDLLAQVNNSLSIFNGSVNNIFSDCFNPENDFDSQLVKIL